MLVADHCTDPWDRRGDVMCYQDNTQGKTDAWMNACDYPDWRFDCGNDDYWDPVLPSASSYLSTHWNPLRAGSSHLRHPSSVRGLAVLFGIFVALAAGQPSGAAPAALADDAYRVTVTVTGGGIVTSVPAGIACEGGSTCSALFPAAASIVLRADPRGGSSVVEWSGACSGRRPTCSLLVDSPKLVEAAFYAVVGDPGVTLSRVRVAVLCDRPRLLVIRLHVNARGNASVRLAQGRRVRLARFARVRPGNNVLRFRVSPQLPGGVYSLRLSIESAVVPPTYTKRISLPRADRCC